MARSRLRAGHFGDGIGNPRLSATASWAGDGERSQKADEPAMFRNAVLNRYDDNHNGRLDSKEKAARPAGIDGPQYFGRRRERPPIANPGSIRQKP